MVYFFLLSFHSFVQRTAVAPLHCPDCLDNQGNQFEIRAISKKCGDFIAPCIFSLDKVSAGASHLSTENPKLSSEMSSETYSLDMCMFFLYHQHAPEVTHWVGYFCFGPCAGSNPPGGLLLGYIAATLWVGYFWLFVSCH